MATLLSRHPDLSALAALAILSEGPTHPYEIGHQLRLRYRDEMEGHTARSLYRAVDRLAEDGLVEVAETVREGRRPERTVYRITKEGRAHLRYQLSDLLSNPARGSEPFEAALARIGYLSEVEAVSALEVRLGALEGLVAHHRAAVRSLQERTHLPRLFMLEVDWKRQQMEAEIDFVTVTVGAIRARELDVDPEWIQSLSELGSEVPDLSGLPPDRIPLALRTGERRSRPGARKEDRDG